MRIASLALALLGVVGCESHITNKQFPDTCMHYEQQRIADGTLIESKIIYYPCWRELNIYDEKGNRLNK